MQFVLYLIRCILQIFAFLGNAGKSMAQASTGVLVLLIAGVVYVILLQIFLTIKKKKPQWNFTKRKITLFTVAAFILCLTVFVIGCVVAESIFGPFEA